jgi:zinc transport system substrate-binding protein
LSTTIDVMRGRAVAALLSACLAAGLLGACADDATSGFTDGRLDVVTAFYPLQFLSQRIGAETVSVRDLTKPGAEPHDVELNPRQVGQISEAGVVAYLRGFQPAVDEAIEQEAKDRAFDASATVPLLKLAGGSGDEDSSGNDPHVWLDPMRFATIADELGERLSRADPAHAGDYTARATALHAELTALDAEYAAGLKTCARREIVTSHTAFSYLAERYGLTQVGITGLSPEAEPSPHRMAEVAREAKATGATTIFFETLVSPKTAETLAREVGATTAVLDPIEGLTDAGADYFSVMRANLATLTRALGCAS